MRNSLEQIFNEQNFKPGTPPFFAVKNVLEEYNPNGYISLLQKTINELEKEGKQKELLASSYSELAYATEDLEEKIRYFKKAVELFEGLPKKEDKTVSKRIAHDSGNLASLLFKSKKYDDAYIYFKKEICEFKSLEDVMKEEEIKTRLAHAYFGVGMTSKEEDEKISALEKSLMLFKEDNLRTKRKHVLNKSAIICKQLSKLYREKDIQKAIDATNERLDYLNELYNKYNGRIEEIGFTLLFLASLMKIKEPLSDTVEEHYRRGIQILEESKDRIVNKETLYKTLTLSCFNLSVHLYKKGKENEAYLKKAVEYGHQKMFFEDEKILKVLQKATYILSKKDAKYRYMHSEVEDLLRNL